MNQDALIDTWYNSLDEYLIGDIQKKEHIVTAYDIMRLKDILKRLALRDAEEHVFGRYK